MGAAPSVCAELMHEAGGPSFRQPSDCFRAPLPRTGESVIRTSHGR